MLNKRLSDDGHGEAITLCIDSTGLKIYGEGEWRRKKHGKAMRRKWRKLHIGCTENGYIVTQALTDNDCSDDVTLPELLKNIDSDQVIDTICVDGAYDRTSCYCHARGAGEYSASLQCKDRPEDNKGLPPERT